jgi:inward rectifier potassium channel
VMSRRRRRQAFQLGPFRAVKLGAPSAFLDPYYAAIGMTWRAFILAVSFAYLSLHAIFGVAYAVIGAADGSPTPKDFADSIYLSIVMLATAGTGPTAPASFAGHLITAVEVLTGLFFSATVTGLIFARFSRAQEVVLFSQNAVIGRYEGQRALMVRLASCRVRPLAEMKAHLSWMECIELGDGRIFRRIQDLPLLKSTNPRMALAWTLIHLIDDASPMLTAFDGEAEFTLTASVCGLDPLLISPAIGNRSYDRCEVLRDHDFADAIFSEGRTLVFDLGKLHDTFPLAFDLETERGLNH